MTDRIDQLLKALPPASLDHSLDQLEPMVWRRIEGRRGAGWTTSGLSFQLAAAGLALAIGLALGWTTSGAHDPDRSQSPLYASYVESGPMARLEGGL